MDKPPAETAGSPPKDSAQRRPEPRADRSGGDQAAVLAADAAPPGDLDGLLQVLTSEGQRRARTLRADALQAAYRHFATGPAQVGGQERTMFGVDGLDRTWGGGGDEPVPGATLSQVRVTFAPPADYARLWRHIEDKPLLVMRAAAGCGGTWSALHLLDAVCAGRVRQYPGPIEVSRLAREDFVEGTGYLVENLREEKVHAIQPDHLHALVERLRSRQARLVILTAADVPDWSAALADYVDELGAPPAAIEVLRRHLLMQVDAMYDEEVRRVLDAPEVTVVLASMTADGCAVAEVSELARRLKRVVLGELTLAQVCATMDRSATRFATWFQSLREPEDRAFATALGVLHGLPYPTVASAGAALWADIQRVERPDQPPRARVFARTTDNLLDSARGEIADEHEDTGYGLVPVRTARSTVWRYPQRLLRLLWDDYPGMHPVLMIWLRKLATDRDPRVRARAAAAAGMMAKVDFHRTYEQVLRPWAVSWRTDDRQAAVAALWLPGREPAYATVVWNLVEEWLGGDQDLPLQMTAVAALGSSVGRDDYPRALRRLGARAETEDYRLKQTICQAVTDLFAAPTVAQAGLVLDAVAGWAAERRPSKIHTALGCFVQIVTDREWAGPVEGERWPLLLRLIDADADRHRLAAGLWRQAMNRPGFDGAAIGMLRRWVRAAEERPYLREPLRTLVCAIAGSAKDRQTLRYYLREWAVGDDGLPVVTGLLLDALALSEAANLGRA